MYYREAKAAVICYDIMNMQSWNRVNFWVSEVQKFEPGCKIYICGNKLDLLETGIKRKVDYHNVQDFAEEVGAKFLETSSKTGENIEELFDEIVRDFVSDRDKALAEQKRRDQRDSAKISLNEYQARRSRKCC